MISFEAKAICSFEFRIMTPNREMPPIAFGKRWAGNRDLGSVEGPNRLPRAVACVGRAGTQQAVSAPPLKRPLKASAWQLSVGFRGIGSRHPCRSTNSIFPTRSADGGPERYGRLQLAPMPSIRNASSRRVSPRKLPLRSRVGSASAHRAKRTWPMWHPGCRGRVSRTQWLGRWRGRSGSGRCWTRKSAGRSRSWLGARGSIGATWPGCCG